MYKLITLLKAFGIVYIIWLKPVFYVRNWTMI